jgi:hypothetical protein
MIIVYVDTKEDTSTFKSIYDGVDCIFLYNPRRAEVEKVLRENPTDTLLCFGHGSGRGLFSSHITDETYLIDNSMVHLLTDREMIGIWCYASQFGLFNNLKGFFTYMFISNENEAKMYRFDGTDEVIFEQNRIFSNKINNLIKSKTPLCEWVDKLNDDYDKSLEFNQFNYSNLNYLEGNNENYNKFTDKTVFEEIISHPEPYLSFEEEREKYPIQFALQNSVENLLYEKFGTECRNVDDITDEEFVEIADFHYKSIEDYMHDFNHRQFICPDTNNYYMRILKK